jgi:hypothetical protein
MTNPGWAPRRNASRKQPGFFEKPGCRNDRGKSQQLAGIEQFQSLSAWGQT